MLSSSKLAFRCFENALNSSMLLKMNFSCKKLWFYVSDLWSGVSEFALIWWTYIQVHSVFLIYYDGTFKDPFLFLERKDETVMSKLIWLVQYAYFYFLVTGLKVRLHTVCSILHSTRAYFTVTKYFLTTSEHVLDFLTSLFKSEIFSEILTYREIFTRNEFSSLNFMFPLE